MTPCWCMRKSLSGYITGRPVVYPVVRLRNRSIAGHPYGTYACHLFSVRSMQRNTPGLLDRRIGPKDMFIVLLYVSLCKNLDIRYRIFCVYFEFTHQESHLRNEPVSHCAYFEYPQPHHVRLEGFTEQCLRIPLCDTLHRIRCWVRTPILFMVY